MPTRRASQTSTRPSRRALLLAILALGVAAPVALAAVSIDAGGPITGGTLTRDASFLGASADGSVVAFVTTERLTSTDTGDEVDLYVRRGSAEPLLLTPGDVPGSDFAQTKVLAGGDVVFVTTLALADTDLDTAKDIYLGRADGVTHVSRNEVNPTSVSEIDPTGLVASEDGTTVVFSTTERLLAADDVITPDIYRFKDGALGFVTPGSSRGVSTGVSPDGSRVYWESDGAQEPVISDPDGGAVDLYFRDGDGPVQSPTASFGTGGSASPIYAGQSPDGGTIVVRSTEAFSGSDTDGAADLYAFRGADPPLWLTGDTGTLTDDPQFVRACDGGAVMFTTVADLEADANQRIDVYRSTASTATRLSTGLELATGNDDAVPVATSADCSELVWNTAAKELAEDTDDVADLYYAKDGGPPTLVSAGPDGAVFAPRPTTLGSGLLFSSFGALTADDGDPAADTFRWAKATGALSLVTNRTVPDPTGQLLEASGADATVAIVRTRDALQEDPEESIDLYRYMVAPDPTPTPSPGPATPSPSPAASATATPPPLPVTGTLARKGKLKLQRRKRRIALGRTARCNVACSATVTVKLRKKRIARTRTAVAANTPKDLRVKLGRKALRKLRSKRRLAFTITLTGAGQTLARASFKATVKP